MGWLPSHADPDVWMMDAGSHWEYICVYVDDLLIHSKNPMAIIEELKQRYKLKGVGYPEFFLGADIKRVDVPEKKYACYGLPNLCEKVP